MTARHQIIRNLATATETRLTVASGALDAIFRDIAGAIAAGHDVVIPGFGRFSHEVTGPRPGRNPRTGEEIQVGEKHRVKFTMHSGLRRAIAPDPDTGTQRAA